MLAGAAAALAIGLALSLVGFSRTEQTPTSQTAQITHTGVFGYSAAVAPGTIYDKPIVTTGQPVFTALANQVKVTFTDEVTPGLRGTASLSAVVGDIASGWTRTVPLVEPTPASGPRVTMEGTLDLPALRALTAQFLQQSGSTAANFHITLQAHVSLTGQERGILVTTVFDPRMSFRYDRVALVPPLTTSNASTAAGADKIVDPFRVNKTDDVRGTRQAAANISILGIAKLPVSGIRLAGVVALILAGLLALGAAFLWRWGARSDSVTEIRRRYRDLIVPGLSTVSTPTIVEVSTMDDLVTLARRYESVIVHSSTEGRHSFSLYDGAVTYRFNLASGPLTELALNLNGSAGGVTSGSNVESERVD